MNYLINFQIRLSSILSFSICNINSKSKIVLDLKSIYLHLTILLDSGKIKIFLNKYMYTCNSIISEVKWISSVLRINY